MQNLAHCIFTVGHGTTLDKNTITENKITKRHKFRPLSLSKQAKFTIFLNTDSIANVCYAVCMQITDTNQQLQVIVFMRQRK